VVIERTGATPRPERGIDVRSAMTGLSLIDDSAS
jgi:hypothetical protein